MKRIYGIILLSATISLAKAQNLTIGPAIGFNHSWQSNLAFKQFKPGINAGVTAIYSIHPHWGIGADVRFSMEGVRTKSEDNQNESTYNANLHYIRIPLKGIYFFGQKGNKFRPKLYAGPSIAFLVGGNTTYELYNKTTHANQFATKTKSSADFRPFDMGIIIGTGFNYRIDKKGIWLNFDLGYTHGLSDVAKSNDVERANRSLTASLGVAFPISRL